MMFVVDFGFAHYLLGETDAAGNLRGSLLYMAPELLTHRQYNEKADLWSVGVILYGELVCLISFSLSFSLQSLGLLTIPCFLTRPLFRPLCPLSRLESSWHTRCPVFWPSSCIVLYLVIQHFCCQSVIKIQFSSVLLPMHWFTLNSSTKLVGMSAAIGCWLRNIALQ